MVLPASRPRVDRWCGPASFMGTSSLPPCCVPFCLRVCTHCLLWCALTRCVLSCIFALIGPILLSVRVGFLSRRVSILFNDRPCHVCVPHAGVHQSIHPSQLYKMTRPSTPNSQPSPTPPRTHMDAMY
mmetsp:Transcript_15962/g.45470  ORF Transcript_15962/g.45470 Transcript_15962/m.45470 type:complete len:128 (-) Transcript_15962:806-1189(-)